MTKKKNDAHEILIYGRRAVQAVWEQRPQAIIRAYATAERVSWLGEMLKWCAANRKAYHLVGAEELEKITHSVHHEGLAVLVSAKPELSGVEFFAALGTGPQALMFLDGVSNPHNVGAITRSMAHFGSRFLLGAAGELPPMSASWARISEGGSEMVDIHRSEDKSALLASLTQKGYTSYALSSKGSKSLYEVDLPERSIFLLGHEIHGLAPSVVNSASVSIRIPGSGKMGSLNVSTAAALCLSEWYRRRLLSAPRKG